MRLSKYTVVAGVVLIVIEYKNVYTRTSTSGSLAVIFSSNYGLVT